MERLTERNPSWIDDELWESACEPDCEEIDAVYRRLKEYEDLEEQGRLIKLPCKVGDTVYYFSGGYYKNIKNWKITPIKVTEFNIKVNKSGKLIPLALIANGTRYPMSSIGKTVFLTKSEAEAELEECLRSRKEQKWKD